MITIKRVKIDHYGRSTYGPEVWSVFISSTKVSYASSISLYRQIRY